MTEDTSAEDVRLFIDDPERYDEGYAVMPRWEDIQHRDAIRSGYPWKWHKCLTEQLDNPAYRDLPSGARGLVHDLRMAVSRTGQGRLRVDPWTLDSILGYRSRHTRRHRDLLIQAGFLKVAASRWPAQNQQAAGTEEKRVEEEPLKALPSTLAGKGGSLAAEAARRPTNQNGQPRKPSATELDDDLRPLGAGHEPRPLRDSRGYLI